MKNIKLQVPGTVANLVCGFDILGMALNEPFDEMEFKLLDERKIIIHHEDEFHLPTEPEKNVAGVVLLKILEKLENQNIGFEVTINKKNKTRKRFRFQCGKCSRSRSYCKWSFCWHCAFSINFIQPQKKQKICNIFKLFKRKKRILLFFFVLL